MRCGAVRDVVERMPEGGEGKAVSVSVSLSGSVSVSVGGTGLDRIGLNFVDGFGSYRGLVELRVVEVEVGWRVGDKRPSKYLSRVISPGGDWHLEVCQWRMPDRNLLSTPP